MPGMYIKICGLRTPEAVAAATQAGADAVGFVFAPGSPRTVAVDAALRLGREVPPGVETVGVFRNQPLEEVLAAAHGAALDTVQLHGGEPLADLVRLRGEGFRTLRAVSAEAYGNLGPGERLGWEAERILLDAVEPGGGVSFDAGMLGSGTPNGFWLLAGGLNPGNVAQLASAVKPSGVDVSSGVESSRGIKDAGLIRDFIAAVRALG